MKTTHQLAQELLDLPDVPLKVELWAGWDNPTAVMSEYDPEGTAFIVDESTLKPVEMDPRMAAASKWVWVQ